MAFCSGYDSAGAAFNGWFNGYNYDNYDFYAGYSGYSGYDLSYLYGGDGSWLGNNGWGGYNSGAWDYQQLLASPASSSLNSFDTLSTAASTFSSPQFSPPPPVPTAPAYNFGAAPSFNLAEFNSQLSANTNFNFNSAFGFNGTTANVNGKGNGNEKIVAAAAPVALSLPPVAPAPLQLAQPTPAAPILWTPQASPPPIPPPPQPVVASSSLVLKPFAPLNFLQTGCAAISAAVAAGAKTVSTKETKPTKSRKETTTTKSTKESKSSRSTRETAKRSIKEEKSEPTKSSLEEDKLKNLKLIKEILEANRPHRLKRDDSLSFEDVLDFYEWLREKKRRINLAKLF